MNTENITTLTVDLESRSYPIHIGAGLLDQAVGLLPLDLNGRNIFVLHDQAVAGHAGRLIAAISPLAARVHTLALEGGEETKSWARLQDVVQWMLSNKVDRQSVLFVMGGGVIGDLGGFAASIVLRGIGFVQVPTTLLAQVDSSVGGKTGINAPEGKNLIGAFYQPLAVLCDTDTLQTLPERELRAGYAEIVKYGLLGSAEFFTWLEDNGRKVLSLEPAALNDAIETSCLMKAEIVGRDEREQDGGRRALLNLGHTFGHAIEKIAGYDGRVLHGEAVGIGLVLAFRFCAKTGLCPAADAVRVERHLKACGLKTEIRDITPVLTHDADVIVQAMAHDKKAARGGIGFILVGRIGGAFQSSDVSMDDVRAIVAQSL